MRKTAAETEIVQPQDIELNLDYAITINFRGTPVPAKYYEDQSCRDRWQIECLRNFHTYLYPYCDYSVVMEFSVKGRLHFHGLISFKTYSQVVGFYMKSLQKIEANICIKKITDSEKWNAYCKKSEHLMRCFEVKSLFSNNDLPLFKKTKRDDAVKIDDIVYLAEDDIEDNNLLDTAKQPE